MTILGLCINSNDILTTAIAVVLVLAGIVGVVRAPSVLLRIGSEGRSWPYNSTRSYQMLYVVIALTGVVVLALLKWSGDFSC
jgi:hypothetical protein